MKTCNKCGDTKPLNEFAENKSKPDGKQYQCRSCQSDYRREHYEKNKERVKAQIKLRKEEAKNYVWNVKKNSSCVDCGETRTICLQFDHIENNKEFGLARSRDYGIDKIAEEIAKCEVVCANCHIVRTASRGNWTRK